MANIKFMLRGSGNLGSMHVRFYKGRDIDLQCSTGLLVDPQKWDPYPGKYKTGRNFPDHLTDQNRIDKLKSHIIDGYNEAVIVGTNINSEWFCGLVNLFNRPAAAERVPNDFYKFSVWWLSNKSSQWRTGRGKTMDEQARGQYQVAIDLWRKFQGKDSHLVKDVGSSLISEFAEYLEEKENYSGTTAKRMVGRIKFFLARAEMEGIEVKPNYKERVYTGHGQDPLKPYLNEQEISRIFNLDLSHDDKLDNIRDSMIIGLWTGLRISDFNRNLATDNIDQGYISIKTQKTGAWVRIPMHAQVQHVIRKRHGFLPRRYNNAYFNAEIKTICMLADIDNVIPGKKYDSEKERSVFGHYKKWELITSHTCRRSFASNLYGIVPNHVLADLGGWASEKQMIHYVKRTKAESAEVLKKLWENE